MRWEWVGWADDFARLGVRGFDHQLKEWEAEAGDEAGLID